MSNFETINTSILMEIERLSKTDVEDKCFKREIERGQAIASLAKSQIRNSALALSVEKFKAENLKSNSDLPEILRVGE